MHDVAGADAYMSGKAPHISGVVAHGNRLAIRLVAPAPDIVARMGMSLFCAVPLGTPLDPKGVRRLPSAGPYYVSSYVPRQVVVLKRNPNYAGSRPHRANRIVLTMGVSHKKVGAQVEAGRADYALDGVDRTDIRRIAARYGPGSAAARRGRQQYFVTSGLGVDYISLNTNRPLFSDVRLRRAVNYAIDRERLARLGSFDFQPGPIEPADQYLPRGMPGFKDVRIYPLTPQVATARRLAGQKRRTAVLYTCNTSLCGQLAQVVKANLAAINIDVQVKSFPEDVYFARLARQGEPFDLAFGGWVADYPDPDDFLNFLIGSGGAGASPHSKTPATNARFGRQQLSTGRSASSPTASSTRTSLETTRRGSPSATSAHTTSSRREWDARSTSPSTGWIWQRSASAPEHRERVPHEAAVSAPSTARREAQRYFWLGLARTPHRPRRCRRAPLLRGRGSRTDPQRRAADGRLRDPTRPRSPPPVGRLPTPAPAPTRRLGPILNSAVAFARVRRWPLRLVLQQSTLGSERRRALSRVQGERSGQRSATAPGGRGISSASRDSCRCCAETAHRAGSTRLAGLRATRAQPA